MPRTTLVAIFREPDCYAAFLLEQQGVTRLDVVSYISHGVSKIAEEPAERGEVDDEGAESRRDEEAPGEGRRDPLSLFTSELVARAAEGKIDPLIGGVQELARTARVWISKVFSIYSNIATKSIISNTSAPLP